MEKKFVKKTLCFTGILLVAIVIVVYLLDPFFHYHKPYFNLTPYVDSQLNQNPGIAEYFDYDSVIIGSSMTDNFTASKFDTCFDCKTVKLSYEAIRTGNMKWMFEKVFSTHDVKNVFLGLDLDPFVDTVGNYYFPIPEYLYDENMFNDVNYIFNKEVLLKCCKLLLFNLQSKPSNIDDAYKWDAEFSRKAAMKSVTWDLHARAKRAEMGEKLNNTKVNFENNVEPYIKVNPDTTFYVFFPPYNLLWWNMKMADGQLENYLEVEKYLIESLIKYPNVRLYGIQSIENIVTNLDYYKDYNHYSPEINDEIMEIMSGTEYLLNEENYENYLNKFEKLIREFDYKKFEIN